MRIDTDLDKETSEKLETLVKEMGQSLPLIVKEAIDRYYESVYQERHPYKAMEACGFIGCADGPENLSSDYKAELTVSLTEKHDHR